MTLGSASVREYSKSKLPVVVNCLSLAKLSGLAALRRRTLAALGARRETRGCGSASSVRSISRSAVISACGRALLYHEHVSA